jgi:hypothetical protein
MDYSLIAYIFIAAVIILTTFSKLSNSGRYWAAILSLILFILIFVFYGLRWFRGDKSVFTYTGQWPPIINMCPDYLVYYKTANKRDTCVDLIGVNRSGGSLKNWTKEDINNPPQDSAKYFPYVYKPGMTGDKLRELCNAAMQYGLTWEGITNGESCTFTTSS